MSEVMNKVNETDMTDAEFRDMVRKLLHQELGVPLFSQADLSYEALIEEELDKNL